MSGPSDYIGRKYSKARSRRVNMQLLVNFDVKRRRVGSVDGAGGVTGL